MVKVGFCPFTALFHANSNNCSWPIALCRFAKNHTRGITAYWQTTAPQLRSQHIAVYGLLLIASTLLMTDMARLRQYIRPLKLAYVDAGP
jgi:hypothetical protein